MDGLWSKAHLSAFPLPWVKGPFAGQLGLSLPVPDRCHRAVLPSLCPARSLLCPSSPPAGASTLPPVHPSKLGYSSGCLSKLLLRGLAHLCLLSSLRHPVLSLSVTSPVTYFPQRVVSFLRQPHAMCPARPPAGAEPMVQARACGAEGDLERGKPAGTESLSSRRHITQNQPVSALGRGR